MDRERLKVIVDCGNIFTSVLYIHRIRTPETERVKRESDYGGRDESKRQRAESQWIVAARPLCHLQYPVAYLSRLQRILPPLGGNYASGRHARLVRRACYAHDTCPWGPKAPTAGRQSGDGRMRRF
ncbi:hypothetical protein V6N13_031989 [Hibiscus sabdariffa]